MLEYQSKTLQAPGDRLLTSDEWDRVFDRIDDISVPDDIQERADDLAKLFSSGKDIEMFGKAIHDVLVPHVESSETSQPVTISGVELASPEERKVIFQHAADQITQLNSLRSDEDTDFYLERVSNIIALSLVGAHSYPDGNGRTARFVAQLIREGGQNRDDLRFIGANRDLSKSELGTIKVPSFLPRYESLRNGDTIFDTIDAAASADLALSDRQTYITRADSMFSTPYAS